MPLFTGSGAGQICGVAVLIEPRIAAIFAEALLHGENVRRAYNLFAWVVMPNHVHVVMDPLIPLSEIMRWLNKSKKSCRP